MQRKILLKTLEPFKRKPMIFTGSNTQSSKALTCEMKIHLKTDSLN